MPSSSQWIAFLVASFLFIQVPGPSLLFTLGRALTVGRRDALLSVLGNALGLVAQVVLVALGLGAVVAASASAYTALKLVGAAYVVYLGVQAIRHRGDARRALLETAPTEPERGHRSVVTGFLVGSTNPKTIVFFVAFLPQFTAEGSAAAPQLLVLGAVFGAMAVGLRRRLGARRRRRPLVVRPTPRAARRAGGRRWRDDDHPRRGARQHQPLSRVTH